MFGNLLKAAVGIIVETPVAIIKDSLTLGGSITNEKCATAEALKKVVRNISDATE